MLKKTSILLLILCMAAVLFIGCGEQAETAAPETTEAAASLDQTPTDPKTVASVLTGDTLTEVASLQDLSEFIDPSGNSQIKLWQDIEARQSVSLPYPCTIDFNGHTITTKAGVSTCLRVEKAGEENNVTTLKGGKLSHYEDGIQVAHGGLVVEDMTFEGVSGSCITLLDPTFNQLGVNAIRNSTFSTYGTAILDFAVNSGSFRNTDVTIDGCEIVMYRPSGANVFARGTTSVEPATIIFGDNINIYSYGSALAEEGFYYAGNLVPAYTEKKSADVRGEMYEGLTCWSTENPIETIDLLMIGNSFCYYYVQELYGIANAAGVEINVTNLYEAGCYVEEHWTWLTNEYEGKGKYQYWITNSMGRWKHGHITTSYEALPYLDWDVITLQQHFGGGIKDYEAAKAKCIPHTKNLYDYLKENHPNADLYWQTTWAYQVGHESMASKDEQIMKQNNIIKLSQELADESSVNVIPSGQAWAIARDDYRVGDVMCRTDLYHDGDTGGGQYLNGCVWFEVLTGKSCIGNTWRPTYALDETKIAGLQEAAHAAVAAMYGADYAK